MGGDNDPQVKAGEGGKRDYGVDKGKPGQKGDSDDCSHGPVKNRGCTDIMCLFIFIAHWVIFVYVAGLGFSEGQPGRVIYPTDNLARVCGLTNNDTLTLGHPDIYPNGANLTDYPSMSWTMNVEKVFGDVIKQKMCDIYNNPVSGVQVLSSVGCEPEKPCYKNLAAACSLTADGDLLPIDLEALKTDPAGTMTKFLTGGGGSMNPIAAIKAYVYDSCVSSCNDVNYFTGNFTSGTLTAENMRTWKFSFPPDLQWYEAWKKFVLANKIAEYLPGGDVGLPALPVSVCPYPQQFCVPFPGFNVSEKLGRCFLDTGSLDVIAKQALDNGLATSIQSGFGDAIGEIVETWYVFIIVAFLILAIGVTFLVILRFTVGLFVWTAIIVTFVGIAASGAYTYWYSQACADDALPTSLDDITKADLEKFNLTGNCTSGSGLYKEEDESLRQAYEYIGYGLFAVAGLYLLLILCSCKRIRLAIALNKVAARFVYTNKKIILLPVVQILIALIWWLIWCSITIYAISATTPKPGLMDFVTANGNSTHAGVCTDTWPSGVAWKAIDEPDCSCEDIPDCIPENQLCWRCGPPRFALGWQFWVLFFSLLWVNAIVVAIGQCTIAGAVGEWYFNQDQLDKVNPVGTGLFNCFRYHLGSLAFGAFILAVVQFVKWWLRFWQKQLEAQKNVVMAKIAGALAYCVMCFERFVKFLNKNAYIRIALVGENFCKAAWRAFCLILRNLGRYAIIGGLGAVISRIGVLFICVSGGAVGYLVLMSIFPEVNPWVCVFLYAIMGYICGRLVMNVFGLAVDSCLVCFITDEELNGNAQHAPQELLGFYSSASKNADKE